MFSHAVPINFAAFQQYALEYGVLYKRYFCRLWLLTVNKLCETGSTPYTENELMKDPLTVLRCDRRILRYYRRIRNIFLSMNHLLFIRKMFSLSFTVFHW